MGIVHVVDQGEGCEQGDALMPLLFCLGQNDAFKAVSHSWMTSTSCASQTELMMCTLLENVLWDHARIQVHVGKTKVYNRAGVRSM